MPASYHIAQELQKYNIPDYRPRQEQYVPRLPARTMRTMTDTLLCIDSRKPSRKSARCRGCAATVALHLVRRKRRESKTKRASSEPTIHQKRTPGRQGIEMLMDPSFTVLYMCAIRTG